MNDKLKIDGLSCYLADDKTFILESKTPLKVVTSAILGYDEEYTNAVVNHTVGHYYDNPSPITDLERIRDEFALPKNTVGMLTAVFVEDTIIKNDRYEDLEVTTVATVGVGNKGVAGMPLDYICKNYKPGTINITIIVDGNLTEAGLANGIITATEAKVRALYEYGVRCDDGKIVTGTTTDTIIMTCTGKGKPITYAGTATPVGYLIGKTVYSAIQEGLGSYFKHVEYYKKLGEKKALER